MSHMHACRSEDSGSLSGHVNYMLWTVAAGSNRRKGSLNLKLRSKAMAV